MDTKYEEEKIVEALNLRIVNSLQQTNDINSLYCDAYNSFFHQRMGEKFDFTQLSSYLYGLKLKVSNKDIGAHNIREDYYSLYHSYYSYEKTVELLQLYQELLTKRVSLFFDICNNLANKASGTKAYKYSFRCYRSNIKMLEKYEKEAISLGNELQSFAISFIQVVQDDT